MMISVRRIYSYLYDINIAFSFSDTNCFLLVEFRSRYCDVVVKFGVVNDVVSFALCDDPVI